MTVATPLQLGDGMGWQNAEVLSEQMTIEKLFGSRTSFLGTRNPGNKSLWSPQRAHGEHATHHAWNTGPLHPPTLRPTHLQEIKDTHRH